MSTLYIREIRAPFFVDTDGVYATYKYRESIETFTIDWSRMLDDDEAIESSEWNGTGGISIGDESHTDTSASFVVGGTWGEAENTVTTDSGRVLIRKLRFIELYDD